PSMGGFMQTPDPLTRASGGPGNTPEIHHFRRYQPPPRMQWPTVTAVIPTLNEAANLRWLLPRLTTVDEIVIVDGESTDGTVQLTRSPRPAAVILVDPPAGKGSAIRAGIAAAGCEVIIMLDADGSMDPAEFDSFRALVSRGFDLVKGTRYAC